MRSGGARTSLFIIQQLTFPLLRFHYQILLFHSVEKICTQTSCLRVDSTIKEVTREGAILYHSVGRPYWSKVAFYRGLAVFSKFQQHERLPPQQSFLFSTQPYLEVVSRPECLIFISSMTLGIAPCKGTSPAAHIVTKTWTRNFATGPCCHNQSFMLETYCLMQIWIYPRLFKPVYSIYSVIKLSCPTEVISRRAVSVISTTIWTLFPTSAPSMLMDHWPMIPRKKETHITEHLTARIFYLFVCFKSFVILLFWEFYTANFYYIELFIQVLPNSPTFSYPTNIISFLFFNF